MGKKAFYGVVGFISIVVFVFVMSYLDLGFKRFFGPKHENVRREIFENTKSYSHGKIQDLARYYEQYSTNEDKDSIAELIKMQFADFDESVIHNSKLRNFLTSIRGY